MGNELKLKNKEYELKIEKLQNELKLKDIEYLKLRLQLFEGKIKKK
jgi:hypothetical protein